MFNKGKQIILDIFDRLGYSLLRKEDLNRRIEEGVKAARGAYLFSHVMPRGYPPVQYAFTIQAKPTAEDEAIARRLLSFYHRCIEEEGMERKPAGDVWEGLQTTLHSDFIGLLANDDPERLAAYLCNMCRHSATHGLLQGATVYDELQSNEHSRRWVATLCFDKLVRLAEALGCLPCENPEHGRFGENLYLLNVEDVISRIEKKVGLSIEHPPILGGLFGLDTSRGILDFHHFFGVYAAWRIRQILGRLEDASVCEIGAGMGFTAYAAYRLGIKSYTIFDLPYVAVMAGYHLIKSLPGTHILLYGEEAGHDEAAIRLYPYWHFARTAGKCFDLTLNQDSFPEIDVDIVTSYLESMLHNTKDFFLSINQEGQAHISASAKDQLFVSSLLNGRNAYELIYRFPYWLREGYTEELYRIAR
jgi:hypothetical protein